MKIAIGYLFSSSVFFIISCSGAAKKDCTTLKYGQFYYNNKVLSAGSVIERNDSMQIVINEKTGKRQKEKIEWTDACVYNLYPLFENINDSLNSDLSPVRVTILDITKKYYTVNIFSQHYGADFNDTIWITRLIGGFKSVGDTFKKE